MYFDLQSIYIYNAVYYFHRKKFFIATFIEYNVKDKKDLAS